MFSRPRSLARFLITYRIGPRSTIPGQSAAVVRKNWNRLGSTLLDVVECDAYGRPV